MCAYLLLKESSTFLHQHQERINQQNISGNLDTPEGGFDALMQVASCNQTLNWEPVDRAHRIVIFVTDASPHIAGDGKVCLLFTF